MPLRRLDLFLLGATTGLGLTASIVGVRRPAPPTRGPADVRGPGAGADSPAKIPAKGWWQILKRVYGKINTDGVLAQAAGVTFYSLLALFPALAALVSLYGLFADPATIEQNLNAVSGVVPGGGMQIITQQVHALAAKGPTALGFGLVLGLATSLWSANAAVKAIFDALNVVYEEREQRSYVHRTLLSMAFTVGGIAFIVLALAAVVVVPAVLAFVGLSGLAKTLLDLLRWPVLLVAVGVFLAALYRYGPSRRHPRWRWVTWGGAVAAVLWVLVSAGFSFYAARFGSYDKTYGSLGAVVGFMTWIWLSSTVVLVGAEVNAETEHQTARDTTEGSGRPLGARQAVKADTVAA